MNINSKKIKGFMCANLMTQSQLARAAEVSRATVNNSLLKGSCSAETACKLAKALGVDPADIMETEEV